MKKLFKTVSVMTLLCWNIEDSQACFQEKEEMKGQSSKPLSALKETEKEMQPLGFNHYFGEADFLTSKAMTFREKPYIWDVSEHYRHHLIERADLHYQVLSSLNELDDKLAQWSAEEYQKIIGFSLSICGERISIEPFLGYNAP